MSTTVESFFYFKSFQFVSYWKKTKNNIDRSCNYTSASDTSSTGREIILPLCDEGAEVQTRKSIGTSFFEQE